MRAAIFVALLTATFAWAEPLVSALPEYSRAACSIDAVVDQVRSGLRSGSPAYQRYARTLLGRTAAALPEARLRELFDAERDPVMLEALAGALTMRTDRVDDPSSLQAVAARASADADPKARAALVRSLRRSSALENTDKLYERLVRDASPEVRREAAQNLVEDNQFVYVGQVGHAADSAVAAAIGSDDPQVTAKILGNISTESISSSSAAELQRMLHDDSPEVRAAAAKALGGVPATEMANAREALAGLFRKEPNVEVRKAILAGIARLGFADSIPMLEQLGRTDPTLRAEADRWIRALNTGLQEWSLVLREKLKLEAQQPQ
jgi:HEAT repeat protein